VILHFKNTFHHICNHGKIYWKKITIWNSSIWSFIVVIWLLSDHGVFFFLISFASWVLWVISRPCFSAWWKWNKRIIIRSYLSLGRIQITRPSQRKSRGKVVVEGFPEKHSLLREVGWCWGIYLLTRGEEEEKGRVGVLKHAWLCYITWCATCLKRKDEEKGEPQTFIAWQSHVK